jgi:hypothetical protein
VSEIVSEPPDDEEETLTETLLEIDGVPVCVRDDETLPVTEVDVDDDQDAEVEPLVERDAVRDDDADAVSERELDVDVDCVELRVAVAETVSVAVTDWLADSDHVCETVGVLAVWLRLIAAVRLRVMVRVRDGVAVLVQDRELDVDVDCVELRVAVAETVPVAVTDWLADSDHVCETVVCWQCG